MWKRYLQPERLYMILFLAILCCLFAYSIPKIYGFSIYPDEFGYWAAAAKLLGYDWSDITSLGSYYSFGYGLLLLPILAWADDPIMAYRIAVGCNLLMICTSMLLIWKMAKRLLPELPAEFKVFFSGIAIFYPPVLFYMQTTLVETAVLFFFVISCFLFLRYIDKPSTINALLLAGALGELYILHMRTMGVLFAAAMVLAVFFWKKPTYRKSLLFLLLGAGVIALVSFGAKEFFVERLYSDVEMKVFTINDYQGQIGKIRFVFSWEGMKEFLISFIGKFLYLGISSFGLFYWAIFFLINKLIDLLKEWKRKTQAVNSLYFFLFLFLAIAGQLVIISLYMMTGYSVDRVIYGRYNEFLIPIMILLGLYQLMQSKNLFKTVSFIVVFQILTVLLINYWIDLNDISGIRGYFIIGISYVLDELTFTPSSFLWKAIIAGSIFIIGYTAIFIIIRNKKSFYWAFSIIILFQAVLVTQMSGHYIIPFNDANNLDLHIVEEVMDQKTKQELQMVYVYEDELQYIDFLQFQLPQDSIKVLKENEMDNTMKHELLSANAVAITNKVSQYRESLLKQYETYKEGERLCLYYNEQISNE